MYLILWIVTHSLICRGKRGTLADYQKDNDKELVERLYGQIRKKKINLYIWKDCVIQVTKFVGEKSDIRKTDSQLI